MLIESSGTNCSQLWQELHSLKYILNDISKILAVLFRLRCFNSTISIWTLDTTTRQGPVSLTQFKFLRNIVSLSPRFWYSGRYKILCMCKNLLRSDGNRITAKRSFHRIWIACKIFTHRCISAWVHFQISGFLSAECDKCKIIGKWKL